MRGVHSGRGSHLLLLVLPQLVHVRDRRLVARVESVGESRRVYCLYLFSEGRMRGTVELRVLDVGEGRGGRRSPGELSQGRVSPVGHREGVWFIVSGRGFL